MTDADVVPISQGPARGYAWAQFEPGNTVRLTHGARSERVIAPLTAEIANDLMREHERLRSPLYRESVLQYARYLAQIEVLEKFLDEHGDIDSDGKVRNAAEFRLKVSKAATNLADRLGLTPLANARLGKDVASTQADLALLLSQLNAARQENK